jgi:hypothetical protein
MVVSLKRKEKDQKSVSKAPPEPNRNRKARPARPTMSWNAIDPAKIRAFIVACEDVGGCALFARTTNETALTLMVMAGDIKQKDYIGTPDDVDPVMVTLLELVGADVPDLLWG